MTGKKVTRRKFVADTGKIGLGVMVVPRHVLGGVGYQAPSDTMNFAVVGFGGMGSENALELAKTENLVAFADVDFAFSEGKVAEKLKDGDKKDRPEGITLKQKFDKAARYSDFREMLDKQKDIDGVVIATPDHLHAVVAKAAMQSGKHVYVQKPLTYSVHEARVLRQLALSNPKIVTQMGNQGHSTDTARLVNEWIQGGIIGPVREVDVWTNRPVVYWPQECHSRRDQLHPLLPRARLGIRSVSDT
jgi:predicted dehydrogenase